MSKPNLVSIVIFGGGQSANDATRSKILTQAGTFFAKKQAKITCVQSKHGLPMVALGAARAAGGDIHIIVAQDFKVPKALAEVKVTRIDDEAQRFAKAVEQVDAIVALPGSMAVANDLFQSTMKQDVSRTIILLNHEGAFESLRGFVLDVMMHGHPDPDSVLQVADSLDDVWNRLNKIVAG